MPTVPSLLRAELMPVKHRRPQNRTSRRRQNRAVLEALFETIDPAWTLTDNSARVLNILARRAPLR